MANETTLTVVGNLTADVELRYTSDGTPVANFTIASTPRTYDKRANEWRDGEALFLRCTAWRDLAQHVASSLAKGSRVIAQGNLGQRNYETREGEKRTSIELDVQEIGPSLRYATAQVERTTTGQATSSTQTAAQGDWGTSTSRRNSRPSGGQQWAQPGGAPGDYIDEPPF